MALDFAAVAAAALSRAEALLPQWLPNGKRRGHEWVCGSLAGEPGESCSVNLTTGKWADFAGSDAKGGDLISLYAAIHNLSQLDACRELADQLGVANGRDHSKPIQSAQERPAEPAPTDVAMPGDHPRHGAPVATYRYLDASGALVFVVCRYHTDAGKVFAQYTWRGGRWTAKAYPAPRPLYGLPGLLADPQAPVLVVEGEKTHEAALGTLSHYRVVTWAGGANAVKTADWAPLAGRDVILWPDADDPGRAAMAWLAQQLLSTAKRVRVIDTEGQPDGWDLADAVAECWPPHQIAEWAKPRAREVAKPAEPPPAPHEPAVAPSAIVTWQGIGLECDRQGNPHATIANAAAILNAHNEFTDRLWFDDFRGKIMVDNRPWTDADDLEVVAFIQHALKLPKFGLQIVTHAVRLAAFRKRRNSVCDYLNSLTWDGTERLSMWVTDFLGVPNTAYAQAVGRNWLISMVARAFKPGCQADHMPVLEGLSGRGKSSSLAILGGEWYRAAPQAFGSKEFFEVIQGAWLVEIPDMVGFGKREHSQIISAITTRSDSYRASYGRHAEDHPRTVIFVATSETDEYLQDSRGVRRYWPLRCGEIDLEALAKARDQLFAEAVHCFKGGSNWHEMPAEETRVEQDVRQETDPWAERIAQFVSSRDRVVVTDILDICLEIEKQKQSRAEQMRASKCLQRLGFVSRVEKDGSLSRRVYRRK